MKAIALASIIGLTLLAQPLQAQNKSNASLAKPVASQPAPAVQTPSVNCNDPRLRGSVTCVNPNAVLSTKDMVPGSVKAGQAVVVPNKSVVAPKCYLVNAVVRGVPQVQTICSAVR